MQESFGPAAGRRDDIALCLEQHGELVAIQAPDRQRIGGQDRQALCNPGENAVASGMAEAFVDALETVEIDQNDGAFPRLRRLRSRVGGGGLKGRFQGGQEAVAVEQAGQDVLTACVMTVIFVSTLSGAVTVQECQQDEHGLLCLDAPTVDEPILNRQQHGIGDCRCAPGRAVCQTRPHGAQTCGERMAGRRIQGPAQIRRGGREQLVRLWTGSDHLKRQIAVRQNAQKSRHRPALHGHTQRFQGSRQGGRGGQRMRTRRISAHQR